MFSSFCFAGTFVGILLFSIAFWALLLKVGLRWVQAPKTTNRRVLLVTFSMLAIGIATQSVSLFLDSQSVSNSNQLLIGLLVLIATVLVQCLIISKAFQTGKFASLKVWLVTLLATPISLALAAFIIKPFVYEAFVISSNAMAPTILGIYWQNICPECGKCNYRTPIPDNRANPEFRQRFPVNQLAVCDNFHVTEYSDTEKQVGSSDRIMVAKFLSPRRWDLIVFESPEDRSIKYIKRLVGLPGEAIHIDDGAVYANGKKLDPPVDLKDLQYLAELPNAPMMNSWAKPEMPALLGEDEYFVLGDFSARSHDSRFWREGAPGHPPYAVPKSHLTGVVTHIFWPMSRWRVLR